MSIGDLFGDDLKALLGDSMESGSEDVPSESAASSSKEELGQVEGSEARSSDTAVAFASGRESETQTVSDVESVVRSILAELSGTKATAIDLDAELGEYGAEGLGLWAVVAEVERQVGQEFKDEDLANWKTPQDILGALS